MNHKNMLLDPPSYEELEVGDLIMIQKKNLLSTKEDWEAEELYYSTGTIVEIDRIERQYAILWHPYGKLPAAKKCYYVDLPPQDRAWPRSRCWARYPVNKTNN